MAQLLQMPRQAEVTGDCRHHWVIDTPAGTTSRGVCKRCGAEREFYNVLADFPWEQDSVSQGLSWVREVHKQLSREEEAS